MSNLLDMKSGLLDTYRMGRTSARGRRNGVRSARLARDLTQAGLAERVGVTRQTVVAIEAGDYAPSVYLALALAQCLDRTVEELFAEASESELLGPGQPLEANR